MSKTVNDILSETLLPEHSIDPTIWKFILAYLETRHVGDAAKAVRLTPAQGRRILLKTDVQLALKEIAATQARTSTFDLQELLERANEIAQVDLNDIFTPEGAIRPTNEIPAGALRTVKKMVVEEIYEKDENGVVIGSSGRIVKIEFWDRLKAVEMLGKHEGGFKDTVVHEHTVSKSLADVLLAGAEKRALELENRSKRDLVVPNMIDVEVTDVE